MSFCPLTSHKTTPQNPTLNTFADPYSIHDIISRPLE